MAEESAPAPSREPIDRISRAGFTPMAVRAALQLDIFTALADGPMSAAGLADALGVKPRRLEMLLYQLVIAEFIELDGDQFANTPMTGHYFVHGSPAYLGNIHGAWTEQWTAMMNSADSIRTDIPQAKLDFAGMSEKELGGFLRGLHGMTIAAGRTLSTEPGIAEAQRMVDVGGGSGGIAIALCQLHSQLSATIIDLPSVVPIAREMIAEAGLESRVTAETANILEKPLEGPYDIATARALFQVMSEEQCREAAKNIAAALPVGGMFYIVGHICDDSRLGPEMAAGLNMMFLNVFDDGRAYTESQYRDWLTEAG
ncbi:MAG: methyltransferase, partial [Alphaproteobacteria bacterium]